MDHKKCTVCGEVKPKSEYYPGKGHCKVCACKKQRDRMRSMTPEDRLAMKRAEYRRNKSTYATYNRSVKGKHVQLQRSAKKRGLSCEIPIGEFAKIIEKNCEYCGGLLPEAGTGLDRIDSSKGYTPNNVVPCCYQCNMMKGDLSLADFISHAEKALDGAKKLLAPLHLIKPLNAFEKDLAFGNCAEAYLVQSAPEKFELLDGRKGDIKLKQSGEILEVKTERRSDETTPNIFVEQISNKNKQTRGGPWAAVDNGCKYIAYLFWPTKRTYVYPAKDLTEFLEQQNYKPFEVFVAGSKAIGLIVPRAHIAHLEIKLEDIA